MSDTSTSRRGFLLGAISAPLLGAACARAADPAAAPVNVTIEKFSAAGASLGKASVPRITKSDAEWRKQLSSDAYAVTRRNGTERPYSGKFNAHKSSGIYGCVCCETALFDSRTKFESGTGWPSFWKPISTANVLEHVDRGLMMERTAVSCKRCDAHLGHVFDDGPDPTGLRYCMNSVALTFVARGG